MKQAPQLPLPPKRQATALSNGRRRGPNRAAVSSAAFTELIHSYQSGACSYCGIPLARPDERVPEGDRPRFLLKDPSSQDFPEGWMMACPCCSLEYDRSYLAEALLEGKAAVFAWDHPGGDHPKPIEISATVRAMVAWMDRVADAYPTTAQINLRQAILTAFQTEGYGIICPWDAHPDLTTQLRSLAQRMDLGPFPAPHTLYVPGETRGRTTAWVSSNWGHIIQQNPGFWERSRIHLVVLPWPDIARNRGFDLNAYTKKLQENIEGDLDRYSYAQDRLGEDLDQVRRKMTLLGA
jgi:hypothetical protein